MRKIFLFFLFFLSTVNGSENHPLDPMVPTFFASRKGFGCDADLCCNLSWMNNLSLTSNFFFRYPQFLKATLRKTEEFDEALLNYLIFHAKNGDILWIEESKIPIFFQKIAPYIDKKLILITTGDPSFPDGFGLSSEDVDHYLDTGSIIHIFAQNNNYQGKYKNKVSYLPIGLDYSRPILSSGFAANQEEVLKKILSKALRTPDRSIKIFCDFGLNNNGGDRTRTRKILANNNVADFLQTFIDRTQLWKIKSTRAFDVSPSGAGQDCYRTWESLALGCIVIVKTSFLDPLYEGLPIVIVQDWNEITEENLHKWLGEYGDVLHNAAMRERLTHKYWMDKIRKVQSEFRKSGGK